MKRAQGCYRTVLLTKRHAYKFPAFFPYGWEAGLKGLLCSRRECRVWKNMQNSMLGTYIVPVDFCWFGGFILRMPRGREVTRQEFWRFEMDGLNDWEQIFLLSNDLKEDNVVWHEGRIKVCDYG